MKKLHIKLLLLLLLILSNKVFSQNVGINTTAPNATLDVNGDLAMRIASISLNAGINNNINSSTTKRSAYRIIDPTADFTITGLDGGADGRVVTLVNTSNFIMSLIHESANSTGANRFILANGVSYDVQPKATITLQYSVVENRWFLVGKSNVESADWKLTGNAGTNQYQNFVGTTDNQNLRFRVNNNPSGLIGNNNVSLGQNTLKNDTLPQAGLAGNVAIGVNALKVNTVGGSNIAIGNDALSKNISADQNIAIGDSTMTNIISGFNSNVVIGSKAFKKNTGSANVAIGNTSMGSNTNGGSYNRSVVIGDSAMSNAGSSSDNVAIGNKAQQRGGSSAVAIGSEAMQNNNGSQNIAIGYQSLKGGQSSNSGFNTSMGYRTMASAVSGGYNVAIGHTALENGLNNNNNVAIGYKAENESETGNNNVTVGYLAHYQNKIGGQNVIVGSTAMANDTAGTKNIAIGHNALFVSKKSVDNIAIGHTALNTLNNFANYDPAAPFATLGRTNLAIGNSAMFNAKRSSFNTAIGHSSLSNDTSGQHNVSIGYQTMLSGIGGDNNVAIGSSALSSNKSDNNVAIGFEALETAQDNFSNVAVGARALQNNRWNNNIVAIGDSALRRNGDNGPNSGGFSNTAVGSKALSQNITGSFNTAIGFNALRNNSAGRNNVALGDSAMVNNTASRNIAIGSKAESANTTGIANIGIGTLALRNNLVGNNNVAIGDSAMSKTTSNFNTAVGSKSLLNNIGGAKNTVLGNDGLINNTIGSSNTAIGDSALYTNVDGSLNTAIGKNATIGTGSLVNSTAIGANAMAASNNSLVLGSIATVNGATANTFVGIGTNTPTNKLDIRGTDNNALVNINNTGIASNDQALKSIANGGVGVYAQSTSNKALVAVNNSNTNPTADFTNGLVGGTSLKTLGRNIFTGSNYSSEFNTGTNEDTYILAGKPTGNVIINNNNNNTLIGSTFSKVGIANSNPVTTLDVFGEVKVGGNIGYGNGIYSDNTYSTLTPGLGLNIIPIGVIRIDHAGDAFTTAPYSYNLAGNLWIADSIAQVGVTVNKRYGNIVFNPTIVAQYSKIIAIGSPQYYDRASLNYYLMEIGGEVKPKIYNGVPTMAYYWTVQTDGSTNHFFDIFGDIMFYGIK
jgi:trimeric autotransporter adhesin